MKMRMTLPHILCTSFTFFFSYSFFPFLFFVYILLCAFYLIVSFFELRTTFIRKYFFIIFFYYVNVTVMNRGPSTCELRCFARSSKMFYAIQQYTYLLLFNIFLVIKFDKSNELCLWLLWLGGSVKELCEFWDQNGFRWKSFLC